MKICRPWCNVGAGRSKYMATAILLSSVFNGIDEWAWYVYALLVVAVLVTLIVGLSMIKEKEK